jgi:PAS domain S-box-containing protein
VAAARPARCVVRSVVKVKLSELLDMFSNTTDGVFAVDGRQRIIYWSGSARALLGHAPEDVLGRNCYDIIAGGDYQEHAYCRRDCPVVTSARKAQPLGSYDVRSKTKDGVEMWLNTTVVFLPEALSRKTVVLHLFRDVTQRRRAEKLAEVLVQCVGEFTAQATEVREEVVPYPPPGPNLTGRELQVLRLLASGTGTEAIARSLGVSRSTARNHIESVLGKLGVHSRLEAVVYATRHRLLDEVSRT